MCEGPPIKSATRWTATQNSRVGLVIATTLVCVVQLGAFSLKTGRMEFPTGVDWAVMAAVATFGLALCLVSLWQTRRSARAWCALLLAWSLFCCFEAAVWPSAHGL